MKLAICPLPGNEPFARRLREHLGARALSLETRPFPDGESYVRLTDNPKGRDVAFVCTLNAPDAKFLPLVFAARTARELGARRVGLVAPYLAYLRQDRRFRDGEAVTSAQFAALISSSFDWLVTVDPHLHRIEALAGLYTVACEEVHAAPAIGDWIRANVPDALVVGPDAESEQWAGQVAGAAGVPHVVLAKTRLGDRDVRITLPDLGRWRGRTPVLVDDIVSSGRTICVAAGKLREAGFASLHCAAVHAVFAGDALEQLHAAGCATVVTTDSIPHATNTIGVSKQVAQGIARLAAA